MESNKHQFFILFSVCTAAVFPFLGCFAFPSAPLSAGGEWFFDCGINGGFEMNTSVKNRRKFLSSLSPRVVKKQKSLLLKTYFRDSGWEGASEGYVVFYIRMNIGLETIRIVCEAGKLFQFRNDSLQKWTKMRFTELISINSKIRVRYCIHQAFRAGSRLGSGSGQIKEIGLRSGTAFKPWSSFEDSTYKF